jgi:hypothetical protein
VPCCRHLSPTRHRSSGSEGRVLLGVHDEWVSAERRYFSEPSLARLYSVVDNDGATIKELSSSD